MPGGIGPLELVIVLVIVLVVFGPKRLRRSGGSSARGCASSRTPITGKDRMTTMRTTTTVRARSRGRPRRPIPWPPSAPRDARSGPELIRPGAAGSSSMATALRPIGHEERLTLVDHLEELRTRLIICVAALRRRPSASATGRTTGPARSSTSRWSTKRAERQLQGPAAIRSSAGARSRSCRSAPTRRRRGSSSRSRPPARAHAGADPRCAPRRWRRRARPPRACRRTRRRKPVTLGVDRAVHRRRSRSAPTRRCCSRCR